jgi:putative membrane protein
MLKLFSTLVAILFLVLGVLLGLLNPTLVSFDYYFNQLQLPLSILLGFAFVTGIALALFFIGFQVLTLRYKLRQANKKYSKQVNEVIELKKQLHQARSLATNQKQLVEKVASTH